MREGRSVERLQRGRESEKGEVWRKKKKGWEVVAGGL